AVFLKDVKCGDIQYGRSTYDYQEGTLVFIAPGQCVGITRRGEMFQPKGWALLFHPDFIRGTQLGRNIRNYTFFSYAVNEALHLSQQERGTIVDCLHNIRAELQNPIDRHSRTLIINNIEMFLNYCIRFYDRQFVTRSEIANKDILSRFEEILNGYFRSDRPQTIGLPTVQYCARELHLSPNYFGDLIKKETGKTAQEHIQLYVIDTAKERIADRGLSISEIAYDLGFKYPAHFTRLFKNVVGCTPNEYRATC
ncbi:MAG: AraC family transcriptional regulator, partial [Tidjanibacter sp.]|nr:AraC family transcriptional regulator [Tidjanibacter sp.]